MKRARLDQSEYIWVSFESILAKDQILKLYELDSTTLVKFIGIHETLFKVSQYKNKKYIQYVWFSV